jgi:hypothetical protein
MNCRNAGGCVDRKDTAGNATTRLRGVQVLFFEWLRWRIVERIREGLADNSGGPLVRSPHTQLGRQLSTACARRSTTGRSKPVYKNIKMKMYRIPHIRAVDDNQRRTGFALDGVLSHTTLSRTLRQQCLCRGGPDQRQQIAGGRRAR